MNYIESVKERQLLDYAYAICGMESSKEHVQSKWYQLSHLEDAEFVYQGYKGFLNRVPSDEEVLGVLRWMIKGMKREVWIYHLLSSDEYHSLEPDICIPENFKNDYRQHILRLRKDLPRRIIRNIVNKFNFSRKNYIEQQAYLKLLVFKIKQVRMEQLSIEKRIETMEKDR